MDDNALLRYSRQIMLPQVDIDGQQKLLDARVLIIGAGGLGSPVAMYLASAGVGTLIICDHDKVDLSNLQRQILHTEQDIGKPKVASARQTITGLNPDVNVITIDHKLSDQELAQQLTHVDLVIDASDNFATRFQVNRACVQAKIPLVSGAAIGFEGQVSVFGNASPQGPCYRCLYREEGGENTNCSENGVLAPVVGIIGSIQAMEAIKVLLNLGEVLQGRLLLFDGLSMDWRSMRFKQDPDCPVCAPPSNS